jgi:hypothetical protein
MKSSRSLIVVLAMLAAVAGPAIGQEPAPAMPAVSEAAPGTGELVIFNDSGRTLIPSNQKVTDNGKPLASLARQTYMKLVIPAGPHLLRPDPFLWKQEVRINVEPGSTHYVVVAYKPERSWALPAAGAPLLLQEITAADAEPLLREMKAR